MTLVLAWYSNSNSRDVLHVSSDSLLTHAGTTNTWAHATKLFRVYPSHSYIAYCGSSLYGLSAVAQGIGLLSHTNVLHRENTTLKARARALGTHMQAVFATFPPAWGNEATLLFCGHDPCLGGIHAYKLEFKAGSCRVENALPDGSRHIALGSGAAFANRALPGKVHSRAIFSVLMDAIRCPAEASVGGYPQAATLFCFRADKSRFASTTSGFNCEVGTRYESTLFGVPLQFASSMSKVIFRTQQYTRDRYLRQATIRRVGR
jgi:hypothetical protein